jgi:transposase
MPSEDLVERLRRKYERLAPYLNEQTRAVWAGVEAEALGRGGVSAVAVATGLSRTTVHAGIERLGSEQAKGAELLHRQRRPGGGRKRLVEKDAGLLDVLEALVEPMTRGDPESPLRWTCKSTTKLAEELTSQGHAVSQRTVCALLEQLEYSLQANRKTQEGGKHPDRNAQFEYIAKTVKRFQAKGQPVISVDTKKKELIGAFKNGGREWAPKGEPVEVKVHDFADPTLGKVVPYGVYDVSANRGWVSVGIDHDTAEFAVATIRQWWHEMGRALYPRAGQLLIMADCGGSNGNRVRLWKVELQKLATEFGLMTHVCHFPPGTSKWNKIEHRMFCHISTNWRGRPLTSREVVVNLISDTTSSKGLRIQAALDTAAYQAGIRVSRQEFDAILLKPAKFHGEWNYAISPQAHR